LPLRAFDIYFPLSTAFCCASRINPQKSPLGDFLPRKLPGCRAALAASSLLIEDFFALS
jgi:hypothetical protein